MVIAKHILEYKNNLRIRFNGPIYYFNSKFVRQKYFNCKANFLLYFVHFKITTAFLISSPINYFLCVLLS